jgi:hypothetical protein
MEKIKSSTLKAVFVGNKGSVFVTRTAEELNNRGCNVLIWDPLAGVRKKSRYGFIFGIVNIVLVILKTFFDLFRFDKRQVVFIHSFDMHACWLVPLLKLRFSRVIGIAYGSDILRRNRKKDPFLRFGFKYIDVISATNENVMAAIQADFPVIEKKVLSVIKFGLPVLDCIDKNTEAGISRAEACIRMGLDPEKILISLGYSASVGQRQVELVEYFANKADSLSHIHFIVPVQYGSDEIIHKVISICNEANERLGQARFSPITDFYNVEKTALMRLSTNVLINYSVSDAFSGTVQEVVYAGGLVLADAGLPYTEMPGFNGAIKMFKNLDECLGAIDKAELIRWCNCADKSHEETRGKLKNMSSWDMAAREWSKMMIF